MQTYLEFEKQIAELEGKLEELRHMSYDDELNITDEVQRLETKLVEKLEHTYKTLDPAQTMQVARHPNRPHFQDIVKEITTDFTPLAGDRNFAEDHALQGGLARFNGRSVVIMGHEKGFDTESRIKHNFGMARPEGYRKAIRLLDLADRFDLPVITLVDTAGAYPGVGAEERGQSEAIARSIEACLKIKTPLISTIVGEGGSGGAVAIAAADRVLMLEHAIYSVISPEGCASILWRNAANAADAARALRITAKELKTLGIIDTIIKEPVGGAHRNANSAIKSIANTIQENLDALQGIDGHELRRLRREKFLEMGKIGL